MAYKQKGCTPITAKVQKGTKGGITNPLLNVGVPMKASPAKETGYEKKARKQGKTVEQVKKEAGPNVIERFAYNASSEGQAANRVKRKKMLNDKKEAHLKSQGRGTKSTTTYSNAKIGKGASATVKSESNTKKTTYPNKLEDVKGVGSKYRAKKPVAKGLNSKIKAEEVKTTKVKIEKSPEIKIANKAKAAEPKTKRENRKQKAIDVKLTKAKAARASGNDRKADRKEKAAKRKADKLANKNSPAKNYKKGYYGK